MKNLKQNKTKRKGFSLIELSIVLIIIGLLIAGVTGGASLIKSSELRSVMGEARGYSVAVNAFFTQFDALPGDYNTAIASGDNIGNGDDVIEYYNGSTAEGFEAWRDLAAVGAFSETITYLTGAATGAVPGTNLPSSKIKGGGWVFDSFDSDSLNVVVLTGTTSGTTPTNVNSLPASLINGTADGSSSVYTTGVLTPTDALSIDAKADDANPETGDVRAASSGKFLPAAETTADLSTTHKAFCFVDEHDGAFDTAFESNTSLDNKYNVYSTEKACALAFSVDVNS